MAFEYNGVVYRDLEPQVRYDAEQIQLLKQADVTINENLQTVNENLQTVNTEINGKLTAPTTPTADSVITMSSGGTVGTKLLSEIGGGGKLYAHSINFGFTDGSKNGQMFVLVYSTNKVEFTFNTLASVKYGYIPVSYLMGSPPTAGILSLLGTTTDLNFFTANGTQTTITPSTINGFTDTVTEL